MPNSRTAYMGRGNPTAGNSSTFTPPFGCNTWQLRIFTDNSADASVTVQTVDELGLLIEVDGSPFTKAGNDFDSDGHFEITVDSSNPAMKVTMAGSDGMVLCKAYRSLDDVTSGGTYSTTLGVS